jgi:hypothetical protein
VWKHTCVGAHSVRDGRWRPEFAGSLEYIGDGVPSHTRPPVVHCLFQTVLISCRRSKRFRLGLADARQHL